MTYFFLALNVIIMIVAPLVVARFIANRRKVSWELFAVGAATFILSQVGHIPFNWLVLQRMDWLPTDMSVTGNLVVMALFLGLSAGVFEECARYLTYRFWAKDARSWGRGLMLGAGHGGSEAIIVGIIAGVNYVVLSRIDSGALLSIIPEGQMPAVQAQITAIFSAPWYAILLGAAERIFAICFHLSASILVMQVFVRGQLRWLFASILWHTTLNAAAVIGVSRLSIYQTEGLIGLTALASLGIIFALRSPEPAEPELEPLPEVGAAEPVKVDLTAEMLDRSRYT